MPMRWGICGLLVVAGLAGCPKPIPAVPTAAVATKGIVVCWDDASERDDETGFLKAFKARLVGAGYDVTSRVCDVVFSYGFEWSFDHGGDKYYKEASLTVRSGEGTVDKIKLTFEYPTDMPGTDKDRLAILLVNELNKSAKLAELARKNHDDEHSPRLRKPGDRDCRFGDPGCPAPANLIQTGR